MGVSTCEVIWQTIVRDKGESFGTILFATWEWCLKIKILCSKKVWRPLMLGSCLWYFGGA